VGGGGGVAATHGGGDGHEWLGRLACRRGREVVGSRAQTRGRPIRGYGLWPLKYCPLLPLAGGG
jgi:hypothetical protein